MSIKIHVLTGGYYYGRYHILLLQLYRIIMIESVMVPGMFDKWRSDWCISAEVYLRSELGMTYLKNANYSAQVLPARVTLMEWGMLKYLFM